ncbi:hypothetical protein EJ05DRAFT_306991 [Pseudovirgaria hyperparasitica]|uniref:Uncharacterized protein n=1 Tax=Pseudovirgaria hyperparasitica TaxID=470096 RepID=A0A6A6WCL3_9PEZI|nr:uncharacterized protein EJ05DRAFT_306991 [Pseudovirgaria hyperparasitica]KAF2759700.1 hypothetical protein EJ05DRAFT_306991 [Pseudovirgaria hyperparasitica]
MASAQRSRVKKGTTTDGTTGIFLIWIWFGAIAHTHTHIYIHCDCDQRRAQPICERMWHQGRTEIDAIKDLSWKIRLSIDS